MDLKYSNENKESWLKNLDKTLKVCDSEVYDTDPATALLDQKETVWTIAKGYFLGSKKVISYVEKGLTPILDERTKKDKFAVARLS